MELYHNQNDKDNSKVEVSLIPYRKSKLIGCTRTLIINWYFKNVAFTQFKLI